MHQGDTRRTFFRKEHDESVMLISTAGEFPRTTEIRNKNIEDWTPELYWKGAGCFIAYYQRPKFSAVYSVLRKLNIVWTKRE